MCIRDRHSAELLNAFRSDNYPALADVGVNIHYNEPFIRRAKEDSAPLRIATSLETDVYKRQHVVCLGWILFRAPDMHTGEWSLSQIFGHFQW